MDVCLTIFGDGPRGEIIDFKMLRKILFPCETRDSPLASILRLILQKHGGYSCSSLSDHWLKIVENGSDEIFGGR